MNRRQAVATDGPMNTASFHALRRAVPSSVDGTSHAESHGAGGHARGDGHRAIRLLVFTSLYPNAAQPRHGIFVEDRLRHLIASGNVDATVVAPVPWFPFRHRRFGRYAAFATVPRHEQRHGIDVIHPRYPVIPKLGMRIAPALMVRALLPVVRKLEAHGSGFDLIDAHYFYPDGVAAARIAAALGRPVVITARGSDINVLSRYRGPRRRILRAAAGAAAVVTVSRALQDKLVALGADPTKIAVLRNGVDLDRFRPLDRAAIRAELHLAGPAWLAVGHLVALKGVHITLAALARSADVTLLVAGAGPEQPHLERLARDLGVAARVRFLGSIAQETLREYYNAADATLLASSDEGMPNVVLESLACGTPVVAAPFASAHELIDAPEAGIVAEARSGEAMASAWRRLDARDRDRGATRRFAQRFAWAPVVEEQCAMYARVAASHEHAGRGQGNR